MFCHWIIEFNKNYLEKTLLIQSTVTLWFYPLHCRIISCALLIVWAEHTVKRRRYADGNGDYKPGFGMGMVLSVNRCIVFAICFPVNYYSEPTHRHLQMTFWIVFGSSLGLFTFSVSNTEAYKKLSFLKSGSFLDSSFSSRYHQIYWWIF